jgi:hypothetical protein
MDMVGHHTPGKQPVALTVEMQEGILDQGRDAWVLEPARAVTGIEAGGDAPLSFRLPFGFRACRELASHLVQFILGQRVGQPEGDGLQQVRKIEVRQVAATEPLLVLGPGSWPAGSRRSQHRSLAAMGCLHGQG